ncbi:non-ribosomal peptide synthetase [Lipingzhangella sp. LS1_29]|uniref:Non-ribosomal peptide synthetase n=1 Tax=Lipingzhangella rawalii TaxID=2055835 RepID=A0ABU2H2U1_9ACTN|nr:non-ribosomal peptide synthetase [Lipingzhangella rawalii]MDS1269613.1 non-ribosomal peptide synthetase [Lipingzhangella rawalii]
MSSEEQRLPRRAPLDARLRALAAQAPDHPAVVAEKTQINRGQLDEHVDELAERIRTVTDPGTRVAVLLPRGVHTVVAPYAVWRAGCVYVPLDRAWPDERITRVLDTSGVSAVILDDGAGPVVTPRDAPPASAEGSAPDIAYIIHTSGSTGAPKGVQISHDALTNLVDNHQRLIYAPDGVTDGPAAMVASTAFDSSIERLALAAHGHTVHVLSDAVRLSPQRLVDYLERHAVRSADFVPSQLRVLVEEAALFRNAKALRVLIVGGERFEPDLWETVASANVSAFNVYGPSENTVNTSIARVRPGQRPNIGHPLPGVRTIVVDEDSRQCRAGEVGELLIGGVQLSPGYLGDPDRTGQSFGEFEGQRCYWSGDLVRLDPDTGALEFVGRRDDQVKINGYRIEPAEVAHHLRHIAEVREAAVTPVDTAHGTKLLASIAPADPAILPEPEALRGQLSEALPAPMVPAYWMVLSELPLTTNLKRDHDALRARWWAQTSISDPTAKPDGDTLVDDGAAATVQRIFAEVLGLDEVEPTAHFFAVGGDSVAVMRLITRLRAETGVELDLADVVKAPTVERLTELVRTRITAGAS